MLTGKRSVMLALGWHFDAVVRGVSDHAREHGWHLFINGGDDFANRLGNWRGDGVISSLRAEFLRLFPVRSRQVVSLIRLDPGALPRSFNLRTVREDDEAIGIQAADYFREKGHTRFAVYSDTERRDAFVRRLSGQQVHTLPDGPEFLSMRNNAARLSRWIERLPKPCAMFCENDWDANDFLNAALFAGIAVPNELAVLGVGNDELICLSPAITLSSIDSRLYDIGRRAAEELDALLDGDREPDKTVLVPPSPLVVERGSTDFLASRKPAVQEMTRFLRRHVADPGAVGMLAKAFHTSQPTIYKLFVAELDQSPKQFLQATRFRIACDLLATTELPAHEVARRAGLPTTCALFTMFRKQFGTSPGLWRARQKRGKGQ